VALYSLPSDGDFYDGALGTFEEVGDFAGGEAVGGFFVYLGDHVTGAEASVVSGSANIRRHDNGVVFAWGDDHADAVILAALIFAEKSKLAGVEEIGVGVEHAQHAGDGALVDGLVDIDGLSIVVLDDVEDAGEIADGGLVVVGGGGGGADGGAVDGTEAGG